MLAYAAEYLCSYNATLRPEIIGPVAEGLRINFHVTGGKVTGPRMRGILRPVGGDWLTLRTDGVGVLNVRATIETDDSALIHIAYTGICDLGEDSYEAFANNALPPTAPIQASTRFQAGHPEYRWLNRLQCFNIGEVDFQRFEVRYDVYALQAGVAAAAV